VPAAPAPQPAGSIRTRSITAETG